MSFCEKQMGRILERIACKSGEYEEKTLECPQIGDSCNFLEYMLESMHSIFRDCMNKYFVCCAEMRDHRFIRGDVLNEEEHSI